MCRQTWSKCGVAIKQCQQAQVWRVTCKEVTTRKESNHERKYRSGYMARAKSNLQVDAEDKRLHADKDRCHKEIAILITRALSSAFKISWRNNEHLDIWGAARKISENESSAVVDRESRHLYIEVLRRWGSRQNRLIAETLITIGTSKTNSERR